MPHLPIELWSIILHTYGIPEISTGYTDEEQLVLRQQTLARCCLVSKELCAIAQPLLYRSFVKRRSGLKQTIEDDENIDDSDFEDDGKDRSTTRIQNIVGSFDHDRQGEDTMDMQYRPTRPLEKFLTTLIKRSDLAACVEDLQIGRFFDDEVTGDCDADELLVNPDVVAPFVQEMKKIPDPDPDRSGPNGIEPWTEWEQYLNEGSEAAEVALLLMLVPNLRCLHLEPVAEDLGAHIQPLIHKFLPTVQDGHDNNDNEEEDAETSQTPTEAPRLFSHLQSFSLHSTYFHEGDEQETEVVNFEYSIPILHIPSLKSFTTHGVAFSINDEEYTDPPIPHLRHLSLDNYFVSEQSPHHLLLACPNLQTLQLAFANTSLEIDVASGFMEAINAMAGTLEELVLYAPRGTQSRNGCDYYDFRALEKLRRLELVEGIFLSDDVDEQGNQNITRYLPGNLETLTVKDSCGTVFGDRALLAKLERAAGLFPRFRALGVGVDLDGINLEDLDDWTEASANLDFAFKIWCEPKGPGYLEIALEKDD